MKCLALEIPQSKPIQDHHFSSEKKSLISRGSALRKHSLQSLMFCGYSTLMVKSIYQGTSQINQGPGPGRPGCRYATATITFLLKLYHAHFTYG